LNEITSDVAEKLGLISYPNKKAQTEGLVSQDLLKRGIITQGHAVSLSNNFTYYTWKVKLKFVLDPKELKNTKEFKIEVDPGQDGIVDEDLYFNFPCVWIPTSQWDILIGNEGAIALKLQLSYGV
jgi:hypothetical protein